MKDKKYFSINVVDGFFEDPKKVVNFANTLKFKEGPYGRWPGVRSDALHEVNYKFFISVLSKIFSLSFDYRHHNVNWDNVEMYFQKTYPYDDKNKDSIVNKGLVHADGDYPLVGGVVLENDEFNTHLLKRVGGTWGALVKRDLLTKLGISLGDVIAIGDTNYRVSGVISSEPDNAISLFSLGPRVMVATESLPDTGLVQPGSQIRYHYRLLFKDDVLVSNWKKALKDLFPDAGWRVRTLDNATPALKRFVEYIALFLVFAGLTTLIVGGVGIGNAVESYMQSKMTTLATFKCLGASRETVVAIYAFQVLTVACFGILGGVLLGMTFPYLADSLFGHVLPTKLVLGVFPSKLLIASIFGLLTTIVFSVLNASTFIIKICSLCSD